MGDEKGKLSPAVVLAVGGALGCIRKFAYFIGLIFLLLVPALGHGAPVDDAIRQQQQIQQQQEQRRLDLERQHREEMDKPPSSEIGRASCRERVFRAV